MREKNETIDRMARLESRVRILTFLVTALGLIFVTGAAQTMSRSLQGREIDLVDASGRVRAALKLKDGQPGIYLYDEQGLERAALQHNIEETGLFLRDGSGTDRVGIAQFAHGGGGLALHGPGSKGAAALYFKDRGTLTFYDPDGKVISRMPEPPAQQPVPANPPKFDLDMYQFGMLEKGPKWTAESTPETQKIQQGHMANINSMAREGKLVAAGPMVGDGDLRGIFVFRVGSIEEAEALAAKDPAIIAGRLKLSFTNWMAPKGIGRKSLDELKNNPNPKYTMARHYLVFLRKGPKWTAAGSPELQNAHLWDIRRNLDSGKYVAAGPLEAKDDRLGILVIAADSPEAAKAIAEADPAVRAGRLTVEMHTWFVAKETWQ